MILVLCYIFKLLFVGTGNTSQDVYTDTQIIIIQLTGYRINNNINY